MTDVGQTFSQNEILLTGANGFLGKVVLGLLLDRFPDLKHLYLLIRPQGKLPAQERFYNETLRSPALAPVAEKRGHSFLKNKITVLDGDIGEEDCGLAPEVVEPLAGRVGVIINCAGLVEFFPPLDDSFRPNVDGVEHLMSLSRKLAARLVHVSTCYVCGEADGLIEETEPIPGFYPRRKGPEDTSFNHQNEIRYARERIRQIYDSSGPYAPQGGRRRSREAAQRLTELGRQRAEHWGWVNTYTYSKSLGEQLLAAEKSPAYAIVRPAIIESALRFPFPGWVEGGRTAAPLILMAMSGWKRWTMRRDAPLEVVPVDLVASAILVVSGLLLAGRSAPVYQLGTAEVNPLLLEPLVNMTLLYARSRSRGKNEKGNKWLSLLWPARMPAPLRRRRARFVSAQRARARSIRLQKRIRRAQTFIVALRKMAETMGLPGRRSLARWAKELRVMGLRDSLREQTLQLYQPFILHNRYIFESAHIRVAYGLITGKDRQLLPWDPEAINWEEYWINNQVKGIERWVQPAAVKDWAVNI